MWGRIQEPCGSSTVAIIKWKKMRKQLNFTDGQPIVQHSTSQAFVVVQYRKKHDGRLGCLCATKTQGRDGKKDGCRKIKSFDAPTHLIPMNRSPWSSAAARRQRSIDWDQVCWSKETSTSRSVDVYKADFDASM